MGPLIQPPERAWSPLAAEELAPLMRELHDSLNDNSLGALRLFERIQVHLRSPAREEIRGYIARLDFEKALLVLEQVAGEFGIAVQGSIHDRG